MSIVVAVNGQKYGGFTSASVVRSLDRGVSELSLTVAAWGAGRFPPGSDVRVYVDDVKVITGYFVRLRKTQGPRQTSTSLVILSKTTDLIDSSAEPQSFVNRDLLQVASALAGPHSVEVVSDVQFTPVGRLRVQPGESIYQTIERAARGQYGLITDNAEGQLVLTRATAKEDGGTRKLVVGQNVLSIDYDFDWTKRFKEYRVYGQGKGVGNVDVAQVGIERDENASRNRLLILVGAAQQPGVTAKNRAAWERNQRIGQSINVTVTVRGWLDTAGNLWSPNTMVSLTDADIGWQEMPLLLVGTKFGLDGSGAVTTQLELHPRKAYEPPEQTKVRQARGRREVYESIHNAIARYKPAWKGPTVENRPPAWLSPQSTDEDLR